MVPTKGLSGSASTGPGPLSQVMRTSTPQILSTSTMNAVAPASLALAARSLNAVCAESCEVRSDLM